MKKIHLVCNAHLDPVWQWEWEEGAAEAISTFRTAVKFCREYDTYIFNHNEALLYKWILEYEPELFEEIKELVKLGRWHIMGGWHLQPDCNMPGGESFVRQIRSGKKFFNEHFGVSPTTAINFDSFGHNRGLVQILKKSGYDSYMFHRPSKEFLDLPSDTFIWRGFDGSEILATRTNGYGSHYGQIKQRIDSIIAETPENSVAVCLWGVGDHGGGASRPDLDTIEKLQTEYREKGIDLIHSTPERYFEEIKNNKSELPVFDDDLNSWAPGCYTSIIRIKQEHRKLENMLYSTERMAAAAYENGLLSEYPAKEFEEAEYDLLTSEFHDVLPGSCIQAGEESSLRQLAHGQEILSRIRTRAFFALSRGQKKCDSDKIPVLIFNPHPYRVETDAEAEMMLWDQNWEDNFSYPAVYKDGVELETQCEKERSNLNLDWRKRVVFHTVLEPFEMSRFDCAFKKTDKKPVPQAAEDENCFILKNRNTELRIDKSSGFITSYRILGQEYITKPCEASVYNDTADPWGMLVTSYPEKEGIFTLLSKEKCKEFCGINTPLEPVHIIESGKVRTVVEAIFGFGSSKLVIRYTLSQFSDDVKINLRVMWGETHKMLKFAVPYKIENAALYGQTAYGEQQFTRDLKENAAQRYLYLTGENKTLAIINNGTYGFSADKESVYLTLLHSAGYCAHPIGDRDIIEQDRYTPHMEQGERIFDFIITAGTADIIEDIPRKAAVFNEQPFALSFYPPEGGRKPEPLIKSEGDKVEFPAVFCSSKDGITVRVFNPFAREAETELSFGVYGITKRIKLKPYEIKTLRVTKDGAEETEITS